MSHARRLAFVGLVLVPLAACNRTPSAQQAPAQVATPAADHQPAGPELRVQSWQELDFGAGAKGRVWVLTGQQFKRLTARLVVARDGKAMPGTEMQCEWDVPSENVDAQLALLLQDGAPFGAKGKRLPSLSLAFRSGSPQKRVTRSSPSVLDSLPAMLSTATTGTTVSRKDFLFAELSGDQKSGESYSLGGDVDSLVESSKNKRMVIGVVVEWEP
jgi:hypothetical protein